MNKSVLSFLFLISFAFVFESCCTDVFRITGSGQLTAYTMAYEEIDTINDEFMLVAQLEAVVVGLDASFSLIPAAYATTCERNYENNLIESTLKLSADKDFTFDNNTIAANSDFSNLAGLETNIYLELTSIEILFNQDFLDRVDFQTDEMTFNVQIQTDDCLRLENEKTLTIDL